MIIRVSTVMPSWVHTAPEGATHRYDSIGIAKNGENNWVTVFGVNNFDKAAIDEVKAVMAKDGLTPNNVRPQRLSHHDRYIEVND